MSPVPKNGGDHHAIHQKNRIFLLIMCTKFQKKLSSPLGENCILVFYSVNKLNTGKFQSWNFQKISSEITFLWLIRLEDIIFGLRKCLDFPDLFPLLNYMTKRVAIRVLGLKLNDTITTKYDELWKMLFYKKLLKFNVDMNFG